MSKKSELKKILEKNPDAQAKLIGYYKYCFYFEYEGIDFSIGGDSGGIYRLNLSEMNPLAYLIDWIYD